MSATLQKQLLVGMAVLSVLIIAGIGLHLLRRALKFKTEWIGFYFPVDVLVLTMMVLTANRVISGEESVLLSAGPSGHTIIVSQVLTLMILTAAGERIFRALTSGEWRTIQTLPLLGATLVFYLLINFVTPLLGLYPEFQHNFLYAPMVSLGLYAVAQTNGHETMLKMARNGYVAFLALGLVFLVVRPSMVADFAYGESVIPGFNVRYYGFGTHPNNVAAYCFLLLCALWVAPFKTRHVNRLAWALGIVSLLLTQSKTSIGLAMVLFAMMAVMSRADDLRHREGAAFRPITMPAAGAMAAFIGLGAIVALVAILAGLDSRTSVAESGPSSSLLTLTGRTFIWQMSLSNLWDNPLFGYGADLWGPAYQQHMQFFVSHAHNQYVHTLGDSGFVGLSALLLYCLALGSYSWRVRRETRWLSVALTIYILLRGVTEAPLIVDGVFGSDFAAHMFLLMLCVGGVRQQQQAGVAKRGVRERGTRGDAAEVPA